MKLSHLVVAAALACGASGAHAITFINNLQVANGSDLSGLPDGVNSN